MTWLSNITRDADPRKVLLTTSNKSILVIEDIDCSVDLPCRKKRDDSQVRILIVHICQIFSHVLICASSFMNLTQKTLFMDVY